MKELEKEFPGLAQIFTKLRQGDHLEWSEKNLIQNFVDAYTTCSLQNDVEDIVRDVQIHHHSRSCKKHDGKCRFGYPKYPSSSTIIAQPLRKEEFKTEREYNECKAHHKKVLEKVKQILEDMAPEDLDRMEIAHLLNLAGVSDSEYYAALSTSSVGTTLILKREVHERNMNNYNSEWLKAWNGNMDLQVCLDFFAVITYITDYYSKDESGLMDILKEVAKTVKDKSGAEQMRFLSQAFLTNRQMGESEAHYRLIPSLHLTQSNVKCIFVATGFPLNRSRFLWKVKDDDEDEEDFEDEQQDRFIRLQDRQGKYLQVPSIHEKYANRPEILDHICLAQFATNYDTMTERQATKVNFSNGYAGLPTGKWISSWSNTLESEMPRYIKLDSKLGNMKLRNHPSILRMHKFREDKDPHEFFYSELLLYRPWRSENELFPNDLRRCLELFDEEVETCHECIATAEQMRKCPHPKSRKINIIQDTLFPHRNNVEEARAAIECLSDFHASHIGETIDPSLEQSNRDAAEEGYHADIDRAILDPDNYITAKEGSESVPDKVLYKPIDISNMDEMLLSVRKLVPEQRKAFDLVIQYCKNTRKASTGWWPMPKAPLLKIHGGAGSGKSKLIDDISKWAEFFLRVSDNRQPTQPFVIKVAPTGKAASIIEGMTLHSAFHFKFGNDFSSLSDKLREELRSSLSKLKIVIVDEMSMVKSDLLYQLNLRLQEIKQNQDYFGGVSVLLFGDLMQLRPVQANFIFEPPRSHQFLFSHEISPLWNLFQPIELLHNHRQGGDKSYAEILNRIRFGNQTPDDVAILQSRITSNFPKDAFFVFGTRSAVDDLNRQKLSDLPQDATSLKAIHIHPNKKDFKPHISQKDGTVNDTPFLDELHLKKEARIMLTYNVDTSDGLTNGTTGTVVGFIKNAQDQIVHVLVELDETHFGGQMRTKYRNLLEKSGNPHATPISRISFEYSLGKVKHQHAAKAKVIQFPLVLAWAITAHKFQGQTVKMPSSLVADIASVFDGGQAYVMLGRVQNIGQLFLKSLVEKNIRVNQKALAEANLISESVKRNVTDIETIWSGQSKLGFLKITLLNIRSLAKHMADILVDRVILNSDIICLTETWISPDTNPRAFSIPGFSCTTASKGRGAGVAVYIRNSIGPSTKSTTFMSEDFQGIRTALHNLDILTVYRSPTSDIKECTTTIIKGINCSRNTFVCGDLNVPFLPRKSNYLSDALQTRGFQQLVTQPTHLQGHILDHVYVNFKKAHWYSQFQHSTYYSDHDAICTVMEVCQK